MTMTDDELANAARQALRSLDDERQLRENPLFTGITDTFSHDAVRTHILRAVESLDSTDAGDIRRHHRHYTIVSRCDIRGHAHKLVADSLSLSRRQFYRDRHDALVRLAHAILASQRRIEHVSAVTLDASVAREVLIDKLRDCGQSEAVVREASSLAAHVDGERAVRLWIVASEAARFSNQCALAHEAVQRARGAFAHANGSERPYTSLIWIAIGEMAIQWVDADYEGARATFESALARCENPHGFHAGEATLFGLLLSYGAAIESERGNWARARSLIQHAERIADRMNAQHVRPALLRLSGRVALQEGDVRRAIVEHREALAIAQRHDQLRGAATSAVELGRALIDSDLPQATRYVEYGLEVAARVCDPDALAMLTAESMPVLLRGSDPRVAHKLLEDIRARGTFGRRAKPVLEFVEAQMLMHAHDERPAIERAESAGAEFMRHGMLSWACDAQLVAIEGYAHLRQRARARRLLDDLTEIVASSGRLETRRRAEALWTALAP